MSVTGTRLTGWLQRHGVSGLCLLMVAGMSLSLSWQIVDLRRLLHSPPPEASSVAVTNQSQPLALEHLQGLFGNPVQQNGNRAAPPTNLQLTLLGSFVNPDSKRSTAIILVAGGKPRRLAIGDEISSGVRLQAVHQDHVVLSRNGRDESLHFPRLRTATATAATYNQPYDPQYDPAQPTAEQLELLQSEDVQQLQQRMEVLRQQMEGDGSMPPTEAPEVEISQ